MERTYYVSAILTNGMTRGTSVTSERNAKAVLQAWMADERIDEPRVMFATIATSIGVTHWVVNIAQPSNGTLVELQDDERPSSC